MALARSGGTLRSLSLSHMHIGDKDGAAICAVMENNTSLKSLDLSNNDLGEKSCVALKNSLMASVD